jgi:hypothetical protein
VPVAAQTARICTIAARSDLDADPSACSSVLIDEPCDGLAAFDPDCGQRDDIRVIERRELPSTLVGPVGVEVPRVAAKDRLCVLIVTSSLAPRLAPCEENEPSHKASDLDLEPVSGIEPLTCRLQGGCSAC